MPSNHLILCRSLLLLPSIFPSIRVFCNESALHIRWPKYWSFSFSISPSNEHSRLISFSMDWLDLLAVQGTQESFPTTQFKSINFLVLSFPYSPTLTSIHDYWKNQSLYEMDLCRQSNVCFLICGLGLSWLFFQGAISFNFFVEKEKNVCHLQLISSYCLGTSCLPTYYPLITIDLHGVVQLSQHHLLNRCLFPIIYSCLLC